MNLGEVIHKADGFYPNRYSLTEKLDWCYEVSSTIRSEINKQYACIQTDVPNLREVIDQIGYDYLESIISGTKTHPKTDVRTWYNNGIDILAPDIRGTVKAVYLTMPEPYRYAEYLGNAEIIDGLFIPEEACGFRKGDMITICFDGKKQAAEIEEDISGKYRLKNWTQLFRGELSAKKELNEPLECEAPYDYLYVDFLLGKMCYYQSDYDSYNQHMAQYNNKIMLYQKWVKMNQAYSTAANFRGIWG